MRDAASPPNLARRLTAEGVGTALLLAIVVGSGVMADGLSPDDGVALLGNALATGAGLVVLIMIFGPLSGAHFNPAVTLAFFLRKDISARDALAYIVVQIIAALLGVALAHGMFELEIVQTSLKAREGYGQALGEGTATFCLVLTILALVQTRPGAVPYAVGLIITAGYWFTSSTSFANPAVTLARSFTNSFAGIDPASMPPFLVAQLAGTLTAVALWRWLGNGLQGQAHGE